MAGPPKRKKRRDRLIGVQCSRVDRVQRNDRTSALVGMQVLRRRRQLIKPIESGLILAPAAGLWREKKEKKRKEKKGFWFAGGSAGAT
jgi:hypothetical protein